MINQAESTLEEPTLEDLRKTLRQCGLQLRSRRLARGRVFSVRDKASGEVLIPGLTDLDEVRNRVWWLLRSRRLGAGGMHAAREVAQVSCEGCGSARVGSFRFCLSCGLDFEPVKLNREDVGKGDAIGVAPQVARRFTLPTVTPEAARMSTVPAMTPEPARRSGRPWATRVQAAGQVEAAARAARVRWRQLANRASRAWEGDGRQLLIGVAVGGMVGVILAVLLGVVGT